MNINEKIIPFQFGNPVQPDKFIGRDLLLRRLTTALLNLRHVSLQGERRTGKSSLLRYLSHPASLTRLGLKHDHLPVYFNFQDFSNARAIIIWQQLAQAVADRLLQSDYQDKEQLAQEFLDMIGKSLDESKTDAADMFISIFGDAFLFLAQAHLKVHLLFDEFEYSGQNPELGVSFYDALRGLPTWADNTSYIIATREGVHTLPGAGVKTFSSPLANIFSTEVVPPFELADVPRLVFSYFAGAGINLALAEKLCAETPFLFDVTGFHPFFLQMFCYHLCAHLDEPEWLSQQDKERALRAFEQDSRTHFDFYWKNSSEQNQKFMFNLATDQPIDFDDMSNLENSNTLKERCLVVPALKAGKPDRLFSSCFKTWICKTVKMFVDQGLLQRYVLPEPSPVTLPDGLTQQRILLIEEDRNWHELMRTLLAETYQLDIAPGYQDAIHALTHRDPYNLVLVDLNLLGQTQRDLLGIEVLKYLEDSDYHVPRIVVTGDSDAPVKQLWEHYHLHDIFIKAHFNLDRLLLSIEDALKKEMSNDFLNFYIRVDSDGALQGVSGEGRQSVRLTENIPQALKPQLAQLSFHNKQEEFLIDAGKALYAHLFHSDIEELFTRVKRTAEPFRKVRVLCEMESEELIKLPWELLYQSNDLPGEEPFFCINHNLSFSRYLSLPLPKRHLRREESFLRILIIFASPEDRSSQDIDFWEKLFSEDEALHNLTSGRQKKLDLHFLRTANRRQISYELSQYQPDIIQFVGQSLFHHDRNCLAFVDDNGETWPLDSSGIISVLQDAAQYMRLFCLLPDENHPHEDLHIMRDIAPQLVKDGLPAVVTMQFPISTQAIRIFLEAFYKDTAFRKPVDWAVQRARNQIALALGINTCDFAAPVLYTRSRDGNLFDRRGSV